MGNTGKRQVYQEEDIRKLIDVWDDDDLYLKADFVRMNRKLFPL